MNIVAAARDPSESLDQQVEAFFEREPAEKHDDFFAARLRPFARELGLKLIAAGTWRLQFDPEWNHHAAKLQTQGLRETHLVRRGEVNRGGFFEIAVFDQGFIDDL